MGTPARSPRLHGREEEKRILGEALDHVASGGLAIVLIEGEAGIGKTRLLGEALGAARSRGMQVASRRAEEFDRARPFGLLAGALGCAPGSADPRRATVAALLSAKDVNDRGPITVTSDPGIQFRVVDAFGDLVEALALAGPIVIGVDDLQWSDPSSLLALAAMGRRLRDLPLAIIACYRPAPQASDVAGFVRAMEATGARHLALDPLGARHVRDLMAEMVAASPGELLMAQVSGAAGNPLFVTELVGALLLEGAIEVEGGQAEAVGASLPSTLRSTILRRLSFLPEDTLQVLRLATILGGSFSLTDLAVVSGRPAAELALALSEAMRARVIEDDGVQLRFRHELLRDSLYEDFPAAVRRGLHRDAAGRLARSGAPPLRVAEHFARGAAVGDDEAITWLTRAAREAAPGSPAAAAGLLGSAIALMSPADQGRDRLVAERAGRLMLAGRIGEAEACCQALLDRHHDPAVEGAVRMCLGHALLAQGREHEGLAELERAAVASASTGAEHAAAQAGGSFALLSMGDLNGAAAMAEKAVSSALAVSDPRPAGLAMAVLALVHQFRGQLGDALRIADEAMRLAGESRDRDIGWSIPSIARGHILLGLDRLEEARSTLRAGRQVSEELGGLPSFGVFLGLERFIAGQWDDALAELEASLDLAGEIGETYSADLAHVVMSLISYHRNELASADASARTASRDLASHGRRYHTNWIAWPRALLLEASGDPARARRLMTEAWEECARLGITMEYPVVGPDLVRLALAEGDTRLAQRVTAAVTGIAARADIPWLHGAALRCRGLAERDAGSLTAAVDAYAGSSRPLDLALASEDAATVLLGQQDQERARPLLDQAIVIYERLGATRDLARAEATSRRAGVRHGARARGARNRPQFGWQSLTPTELVVAGLVADGLSNPQIGERLFISRRTVQAHLAHVFAKLGISSRAQLAAEVTRRQEGGGAPPRSLHGPRRTYPPGCH